MSGLSSSSALPEMGSSSGSRIGRTQLNLFLNGLIEEEAEAWSRNVIAKKADLERDGPTTWIKGYNSLQNKGREVDIQATWDTGCTQAIANLSVIKALGIQIEPLKRNMKIIDAGNKTLAVLGTARLFIQAEHLGVARKSIEVAVIEGGYEKEILISLFYLKKWDMVHSSFPFQTISDFCD